MQSKSNIEFYIFEEASMIASWQYACTLIEKHYLAQQTIYIHTESPSEAERIDNLLWTFREDSFVPHEIYQKNEEKCPVQIGYPGNEVENRDHLLNLSKHLPNHYQTFGHVIEIVFKDPSVQQLARERFKQYREAGHPIQTHKMKSI